MNRYLFAKWTAFVANCTVQVVKIAVISGQKPSANPRSKGFRKRCVQP